MICKVIDTIENYALLSSVKSVAVGVSGGADSMCLLHILSSLKEKYGIIIKAVHVNHNLRGEEALRDERLVEEYCKLNGIELLLFSEDISSLSKEMGVGEEECGRIVRYNCFHKAECDAVAVAHTLSDSIETTVYNLLRGTGTKGLCGIPVKREPNIIRPLISCTRDEIERYCDENNVPYITDSTNLTDDYKRNYIRHNIIPLFEEVNSAYDRNIYHTVSILRAENDFIETSARNLIDEAKVNGGYKLKDFLDAHFAVRKRAVSILLYDKMSITPEFRHIELVNNIIEENVGKVEIGKNLYISVGDEMIFFEQKSDTILPWACSLIDGIASAPYGIFKVSDDEYENADVFDADKTDGELILTSRRQGDVFTFKDRGISKSLKKLFNELKIPVDEREKIAVLRDNKNVVWVEGIGVNSMFVPDNDTINKNYIIKEE